MSDGTDTSPPSAAPNPSSTPPSTSRTRTAQFTLSACLAGSRRDALLDTFSRALRRLLRTPAPDLAALSVKLDLAIDHYAWESTGGEACMAALKRDAHRLARYAA